MQITKDKYSDMNTETFNIEIITIFGTDLRSFGTLFSTFPNYHQNKSDFTSLCSY